MRFDNEPRAVQGLTWVKPHDVRRRDARETEGLADETQAARGEASAAGQ